MHSTRNTVLKLISYLLIGLVMLLAFLLVGVRLFNVQVYAVLSGSMEPDYPTGSLIYVRPTEPSALAVGDVITFRLSGSTTATHRIVELVADENDPTLVRYRTKGDANNAVDGKLVQPQDVIGTPVLMIPLLGYLATYIGTPSGTAAAIAVSAALILAVLIIDVITGTKKKEST